MDDPAPHWRQHSRRHLADLQHSSSDAFEHVRMSRRTIQQSRELLGRIDEQIERLKG